MVRVAAELKETQKKYFKNTLLLFLLMSILIVVYNKKAKTAQILEAKASQLPTKNKSDKNQENKSIKSEQIQPKKNKPTKVEQKANISCVLSATKKAYPAGSIPDLSIAIQNNTTKEVMFVKKIEGSDYKRRYPYCYFEIIGPMGHIKRRMFIGCGNVANFWSNDFVKLKPGQKFDPFERNSHRATSYQINAKTFAVPGKYKLTFIYSTNSKDLNKWRVYKADMMSFIRKVPKLTLKSNTLELEFTALPSLGVFSPKADLSKTIGPKSCTMCHFAEANHWKKTKHSKTFKTLEKKALAKTIARKMQIKGSIKNSPKCFKCHYTTQFRGSQKKAIAGISCESCHGTAADWIHVHNQLGLPKKQRIAKSVTGGMLHPSNLYSVVQNCYQCHTLDAKLVSKGGHPMKPFAFMSSFSGKIRHNFFSGQGKNRLFSKKEKRMIYITGLMLDLEYSVRVIRKIKTSTDKSTRFLRKNNKHFKYMSKKISRIWRNLKKVDKLANIAEVKAAVFLLKKFRLDTDPNLLAPYTKKFTLNHDGSKLAAIDPLIPKEN